MSVKFLKICDNCMDYDREKRVCLIRFTILRDGVKKPMKRKSKDNGCHVFFRA